MNSTPPDLRDILAQIFPYSPLSHFYTELSELILSLILGKNFHRRQANK